MGMMVGVREFIHVYWKVLAVDIQILIDGLQLLRLISQPRSNIE